MKMSLQPDVEKKGLVESVDIFLMLEHRHAFLNETLEEYRQRLCQDQKDADWLPRAIGDITVEMRSRCCQAPCSAPVFLKLPDLDRKPSVLSKRCMGPGRSRGGGTEACRPRPLLRIL
jgi:hypothetical protein